MVLKKRKRTAIGKMAMEKDYPKINFEQAIDLVISDKSAEGLRPHTLTDYKKNWGYFVKWLVKNYEIETIDELTPQTFRLRVFNAMFNHLEREELIAFNPMDSVRLLRQDIDLTNCFTDILL